MSNFEACFLQRIKIRPVSLDNCFSETAVDRAILFAASWAALIPLPGIINSSFCPPPDIELEISRTDTIDRVASILIRGHQVSVTSQSQIQYTVFSI